MSFINRLKDNKTGSGILYFYIHFVTEVICFFCITKNTSGFVLGWTLPFVYDALAFVPQSVVGEISDRFPRIRFGTAGVILMAAAGAVFWLMPHISPYIPLVLLCIGNVFVHVNGAEVTLRCSDGKLSPSAIFVSGGSFGVITGRIFASQGIPYPVVIAMTATAVPFTILAEKYRESADKTDNPCRGFNYANPSVPSGVVIALTVFVVAVRGYMGYGIPTTWNKTVLQSVILYFSMGVGKALGGILADIFGVKKIALISALAALPLLLAGDNIMLISLVGVMFFSMTMSVTLAVLVSVLNRSPGLAFGWTTIGLFAGTAPIFFIRFNDFFSSCIMITVLTLISCAAMMIAIRRDGEQSERNHSIV